MTGQTVTAIAPAEVAPRIVAYIIDAVILAFAWVVLATIVVVGSFVGGDSGAVGAASRSILFGAISFLYFGYGWTTWRASPGQRAMGIMTVRASDSGALTWNESALRWGYLFGPSVLSSLFTSEVGGVLSLLVSLALLGYYLYLYRTMTADPRRQAFHDKQSRSIVVKAAT